MRVLEISLEASMAASLPDDEDDEPCPARTRPSLVCCRRGRYRLLRGVLASVGGLCKSGIRDAIAYAHNARATWLVGGVRERKHGSRASVQELHPLVPTSVQ